MYRRVRGIHVVESIDLIMFFRPNELVDTTGINSARAPIFLVLYPYLFENCIDNPF